MCIVYYNYFVKFVFGSIVCFCRYIFLEKKNDICIFDIVILFFFLIIFLRLISNKMVSVKIFL